MQAWNTVNVRALADRPRRHVVVADISHGSRNEVIEVPVGRRLGRVVYEGIELCKVAGTDLLCGQEAQILDQLERRLFGREVLQRLLDQRAEGRRRDHQVDPGFRLHLRQEIVERGDRSRRRHEDVDLGRHISSGQSAADAGDVPAVAAQQAGKRCRGDAGCACALDDLTAIQPKDALARIARPPRPSPVIVAPFAVFVSALS